MTRVLAKRIIDASAERVFHVISDIEGLPETNADIVDIEFLSEQRSGLGTRFRETRRMKKRELITELEVTHYDPPSTVRMVADTHGTVWDTLFTVTETEGGCELTIEMDARAHKLVPRLLNPLLKGMFRKGIEKHLDTLKEHCERAP